MSLVERWEEVGMPLVERWEEVGMPLAGRWEFDWLEERQTRLTSDCPGQSVGSAWVEAEVSNSVSLLRQQDTWVLR